MEVYADRPRSGWSYAGGEILMATEPVRFEELPVTGPWVGASSGTTVGHVHWYVGDLLRAEQFYVDGLGLDITTRQYPRALFTSAGGYHHHVGMNVWAAGSRVASSKEVRILFWELVVRDGAVIEAVAARMFKAGYQEVASPHGERAFVDDVGVCVAVVE